MRHNWLPNYNVVKIPAFYYLIWHSALPGLPAEHADRGHQELRRPDRGEHAQAQVAHRHARLLDRQVPQRELPSEEHQDQFLLWNPLRSVYREAQEAQRP